MSECKSGIQKQSIGNCFYVQHDVAKTFPETTVWKGKYKEFLSMCRRSVSELQNNKKKKK